MGYDKIPRQKLSLRKKDKKWREACISIEFKCTKPLPQQQVNGYGLGR